ncbi:MAG: Ca2+-dependent phosphoinositide-specific phospholipase C [Polyangiales bacterium]
MRRPLAVFAVFACASCSPAPRPADADAAAEASVEDSGLASDADAPDASAVDANTCPVDPTPMPFVRSAAAAHAMDESLRMNHLQAKATHNSYHLRPRNVDLPDWNYEHAPLPTQLSMLGVRGLELDLNYNARCNRFEVFHVAAVDDRTTCRQFTECLLHIRNFSQQNPGHHPLFIHIEPKGSEGNYSAAGFAEIEREILTVFDRSWIITPDEVRGASSSLSEAVTTRGWPTLAQTRGRVLFYLDNTTAPRTVYTNGGRDLVNRLMFVDSRVGDPFAAVMVLNDPIGQATEIASALRAGYIVRTRADSNPTVAMTNDRAQLTAALASGAQIVSTDFPARITGSEYFVEIPMGIPSRCSSVTAPMGCTPALVEDPSKLTAR